MPNIETFVDVQIILGSQVVERAGFGVAMILSSTTGFSSDRVRTYNSLTAVLVDFPAGTPEGDTATLYFGQVQKPTKLLIGAKKGGDASWVAALDACIAIDNSWYALIALDHTAADVLLLAAHIEALKKIYITSSADATILTSGTTDIAYQLKQLLYTRTACLYSAAAASYPEAGWLGGVLPLSVGNSNWAFKQIVGIAADNLTDTQFAFAQGKHCNCYVPVAGVSVTTPGVMAGGEYIDITRGIDSLQADMEENLYGLLVNTNKVPYTNKGITAIENIMRSTLQQYVDNGFLSDNPAFTVTGPDANSVALSDKQTRVLNGLVFTGTLAGAINKINVTGYLSF